ncbi:hypothetical protein [Cohnella sp. GCM10027633]|uniref:hypothetical protein n=1 Tax=unclassified Cohnella TaxID=2636738 RepID=UPI00363CF300
MIEKAIVALLFFAALVVGDWKRKATMSVKAAISYSVFVLVSVYLAIIFISGRAMYNLTDLMQGIYGPMAKSVVSWLKG